MGLLGPFRSLHREGKDGLAAFFLKLFEFL